MEKGLTRGLVILWDATSLFNIFSSREFLSPHNCTRVRGENEGDSRLIKFPTENTLQFKKWKLGMERNGKIFVLLSNLLLQQQLDFAQCDYYWSGMWIETARINNCARRKFERAFCIRMDFRWTVKAISIEVAIEALNINSTRGPVLNIREECPNLVRKKKKRKKTGGIRIGIRKWSLELALRGLAWSKGSKLQVFQGGY